MKIFVTGHNGMVGSAVVREVDRSRTHSWCGSPRDKLDLRDSTRVAEFIREHRPDAVVMAGARVGGIGANSSQPVDFLLENLSIQNSVLDSAFRENVDKVVFLGSSCIYPRLAEQPIRPEALLTGELEKTNEAYSIAKIAGIKLVEGYRAQFGKPWISVMPTNLYGPGDSYDEFHSHVIPSIAMKIQRAILERKDSVVLWGTGAPLREFLHVDDLAKAIIIALEKYNEPEPLNIGSGEEIDIRGLAALIAEKMGFAGRIEWDPSKPDGVPRKLLDSSRIHDLGWKPTIGLSDGLEGLTSLLKLRLEESSEPSTFSQRRI